jgi:hypothetical protein
MAAIQAACSLGVSATFSHMGFPAAGDASSRDGGALRADDCAIGSAAFDSNSAIIDRHTIGTRGASMVAIRLTSFRPGMSRACLVALAWMEAAASARPKGIGRIRAADDEERDQDGSAREQTSFHGRIPQFKN